MATHKSAEKRSRQSGRRAARNESILSSLKTFEKKVRLAVEKRDGKTAVEALRTLTAQLDKAATKGAIHARNAARKVSRLAKLVNEATK